MDIMQCSNCVIFKISCVCLLFVYVCFYNCFLCSLLGIPYLDFFNINTFQIDASHYRSQLVCC